MCENENVNFDYEIFRRIAVLVGAYFEYFLQIRREICPHFDDNGDWRHYWNIFPLNSKLSHIFKR